MTEDFYILTAFRVRSKKHHAEPKLPIIFQHGLIDDGGTWFFNNATLDLSLELVDKGYEVWVANSRGTVYSNEHMNFSTRDVQYWNFSFDEMG